MLLTNILSYVTLYYSTGTTRFHKKQKIINTYIAQYSVGNVFRRFRPLPSSPLPLPSLTILYNPLPFFTNSYHPLTSLTNLHRFQPFFIDFLDDKNSQKSTKMVENGERWYRDGNRWLGIVGVGRETRWSQGAYKTFPSLYLGFNIISIYFLIRRY